MKYYTPELIVMGQSTDEDILDRQDRLWGEASEGYSQYLAQVRSSFPKGVRRLFSRYYLHDAVIHRIGQKDKFFLIELQLDTPPRSFLTFRYRLLRPAEVNKEALPPAGRSKGAAVLWRYAEIEQQFRDDLLQSPCASTWVKDEWLTQAEEFDGKAGSKWPFWAHRILLSNGWELTVCFYDVDVEEYENLLVPATANGRLAVGEPASPSACGSDQTPNRRDH
jgi:hypothetical protein